MHTKMMMTLLLLVSTLSGMAQDDRNDSPYFQVVGESATTAFPLLSTDVEAHINGPIADVTLTQSYQNKGTEPIEAIYVFPASTRSAVYDMEMHIGDRIVKAVIQEKQKARQTYEKAKQEGKRTSLLEQHMPNVFQMNVANIMPGEVVKVVMKYTEFLIPEDQQYTFHFPTVVGPRYTGEAPAKWAAQGYSKAGKSPTSTFDMKVTLQTAIPISALRCGSHKITSRVHHRAMLVELDDDGYGGNRDFILEYSLSGREIETGVQTYSAGGEHFFLCQIEPPSLDANPTIAPREYIFIMDVSGSMTGFPLDVSKHLMHKLFTSLRPTDKFNILFFAGSAFALSPTSLDATTSNVAHAMASVTAQSGGGGTNMLGAIQKAMASPKEDGYSRSFVIITDGYVSVDEQAFDYVRDHLEDSNFFAFGIGSSVNRNLIEGLAHVGRARPFIVTDVSDAQKEADRLRKYIQYPVLSNIEIRGHAVELYDIAPDHIPDLMAGRPIYFFGKYRNADNAMLEISGQNGCTPFYKKLDLPSPDKQHKALSQLWARETIKHLADYNDLRADQQRIDKVTQLGLKYNLLTKYTSFVAVDHEIVNEAGSPQPVKQLLPMPQGVPNQAIGFEMEIEGLDDGMTHQWDITVRADDGALKAVAESMLEAILSEKMTEILIYERTIHISTNAEGELIKNNQSHEQNLSQLLITALKSYGFSVKDLQLDIIIRHSK